MSKNSARSKLAWPSWLAERVTHSVSARQYILSSTSIVRKRQITFISINQLRSPTRYAHLAVIQLKYKSYFN